MNTLLIVLACIAGVIVLAIGVYLGYLFLSFKRIPDNIEPEIRIRNRRVPEPGEQLHIISWNLGFGAYSDDYSFFMNGGTESRAYSRQAAIDNINADIALLKESDPDIMLLQEVDKDSDRAWHTDQSEMIRKAFAGHSGIYAMNYHSAYLFWPLKLPHGASQSGILTLTRSNITAAVRRQLPIEGGFMKFLDLDRCYSLTRIPVANGAELCLYALHLSAYTTDGSIATRQLELLLKDMESEYAKGNYVVAGGDFNKDIRGDASAYTGISGRNYSWAKPFPIEIMPKGFTLVNSFDPNCITDSCRASDAPYVPGKTFTVTLDAFITSDNIQVDMCKVIDAGFRNSDHNPIEMRFRIIKDIS